MKQYSITATYGDRSTTRPLPARDNVCARILAVLEINKCYGADKRFDIGEIVVKDPKGEVIMKINAEE
jgi:hypothetical protein